MIDYFVIPVVVILVVIVYFVARTIVKKNAEKYVLIYNVSYFLSVVLIALFWVGSNGLTWRINTEVWSHFGAFIGAFLLAGTLLFQVRSFRRQQIEAKFYEMVKYYRENISEMRYRNPFYYEKDGRKVDEEYLTGRRVIKTIFEQYKVARKICHIKDISTSCVDPKNNIQTSWDKIYKKGKIKFELEEWKKKFALNEIAYQITFWGIPLDTDVELKKYIEDSLSDKTEIKPLIKEIKEVTTVWEFELENQASYSSNLKAKERPIFENLNKPIGSSKKVKFFGGHQYHLGHYFRHLFQAVKFIDNQPSWLMSQKEKYDYVKTLRAQMSNYEQAILFINSLTKLGRNWEYDNDEKNLISDYNLIKNLPENFIPYMKPQYYYPEVNFEWDRYANNEIKSSAKTVQMTTSQTTSAITQEQVDQFRIEEVENWRKDISFWRLIFKKYSFVVKCYFWSNTVFGLITLALFLGLKDHSWNWFFLVIPLIIAFLSIKLSRKPREQVLNNYIEKLGIKDVSLKSNKLYIIQETIIENKIGVNSSNSDCIEYLINHIENKKQVRFFNFPVSIWLTSILIISILGAFFNILSQSVEKLEDLEKLIPLFIILIMIVHVTFVVEFLIKNSFIIAYKNRFDDLIRTLKNIQLKNLSNKNNE